MVFDEQKFLEAARLVGLEVKKSDNPGVVLKDNTFIPGGEVYQLLKSYFLPESLQVENLNIKNSYWPLYINDDSENTSRSFISLDSTSTYWSLNTNNEYKSIVKKSKSLKGPRVDILQNNVSDAFMSNDRNNWPVSNMDTFDFENDYKVSVDSVSYVSEG